MRRLSLCVEQCRCQYRVPSDFDQGDLGLTDLSSAPEGLVPDPLYGHPAI